MFTLHNPTKIQDGDDYGKYLVTSHPCPACGETITIMIEPQQLFKYNQGALAQDVLEGFSLAVIERFITGYCEPCWDNIFPDDDDDDDWDDEYISFLR